MHRVALRTLVYHLVLNMQGSGQLP